MKIIDVAKKLDMSNADVMVLFNGAYKHHMNVIHPSDMAKIQHLFQEEDTPVVVDPTHVYRELLGVNCIDGKFSAVQFKFAQGSFDDQLAAIAKDLDCDKEKLVAIMVKHGYPILETEVVGMYKSKPMAFMEYQKLFSKSTINRMETSK